MKKHHFKQDVLGDFPTWITQYIPDTTSRKSVVLVLPDIYCFSGWGSLPNLCERLCHENKVVMSIDFSCGGVVDFDTEITRPDLFEKNSISRQVRESELLIKKIIYKEIPGSDYMNPTRIFVLGHSYGGATALILASKSPFVTGIVTWSALSRIDSWNTETIKLWEKHGHLHQFNPRTGTDLFLGVDFLNDVRFFGRTGIVDAVNHIQCPMLILHGDKDETVPIEQAYDIFISATYSDAELHIIPEGDHTFGAKHPCKLSTQELEIAINKTVDWLNGQA